MNNVIFLPFPILPSSLQWYDTFLLFLWMLFCLISFLKDFPQYRRLNFKWSRAEPKGCFTGFIYIYNANKHNKRRKYFLLKITHLEVRQREINILEKLRFWSCRCKCSQLTSLTEMTYWTFSLVNSRHAPKCCCRLEMWKSFPASHWSKAVNRIQHWSLNSVP